MTICDLCSVNLVQSFQSTKFHENFDDHPCHTVNNRKILFPSISAKLCSFLHVSDRYPSSIEHGRTTIICIKSDTLNKFPILFVLCQQIHAMPSQFIIVKSCLTNIQLYYCQQIAIERGSFENWKASCYVSEHLLKHCWKISARSCTLDYAAY